MKEIKGLQEKAQKYAQWTGFPNGTVVEVAFTTGYKACLERVRILESALEFYAKGKTPYGDREPGDRLEFGCGCCAGIETEEEGSDCDDRIQGQTARDALKEWGGE